MDSVEPFVVVADGEGADGEGAGTGALNVVGVGTLDAPVLFSNDANVFDVLEGCGVPFEKGLEVDETDGGGVAAKGDAEDIEKMF